MAFGDAQVKQQLAQGLAFHRTAVVGVQRKLVGLDALLADGFSDQLLRQVAALDLGNHPADHIATEDVQHSVKWVVHPGRFTAQIRDVP